LYISIIIISMYIIHEQKQKSNFLILSVYVVVFIFLLFRLIQNNLSSGSKLILVLLLLVDIVFLISFYQIKFRVTSEGLEFGYGILKNKVTKNNIESISIDNSKGNFFGYGIRFSKDKTIGFIAKHGDGLKIVYKDQRKFFITIDNPREALDIIKENNYVSR
jgi:predicted membrane protein